MERNRSCVMTRKERRIGHWTLAPEKRCVSINKNVKVDEIRNGTPFVKLYLY